MPSDCSAYGKIIPLPIRDIRAARQHMRRHLISSDAQPTAFSDLPSGAKAHETASQFGNGYSDAGIEETPEQRHIKKPYMAKEALALLNRFTLNPP